MVLQVERGNLFELPNTYVLVHCISEDCAFGAGIALEFQRRFGLRDSVKQCIKERNLHFPCIVGYNCNSIIINMVTKNNYWNKPTYEDFECALDAVVMFCKKNHITHLAMPKIGCGLDKLQWDRVQGMIESKFKDMDIRIIVRYL